MIRISDLDTTKFKDLAENFVYVSRRFFPDHEITKRLKSLFESKFGPILKKRGSKEEFQFLLKVGREIFKKDFTEIANTLDADTLAFLKSADISQFEHILEKRLDKKTGKYLLHPVGSQYTQKQTKFENELESLQTELTNLPRGNITKALKPKNRFRILENRLYSWNLRILVNRLVYWNTQQGPHTIRIKNRKKGYLLPSEDFLVDYLFDYRKNELHKGIENAEKNLKDLYKLLYLITPENPMAYIEEIVKRLKKWESKSPQLSKKDAVKVLYKLESDEFEPSKEAQQIIEHASFKSYQSDYIIKYKNEFGSVIEKIESLEFDDSLPISDFNRLCRIPSIHYEKVVLSSFKVACQKNGMCYERLAGKKIKLVKVQDPSSPNTFQALKLIP